MITSPWRAATTTALLVATACVSGQARNAAPAESGVWTGSFRQPQLAASAVVGPATPGRAAAYGSISLTPIAGQLGKFRVELSISAPVESNAQLAWAVFSGPCGSPSPAVAGLTEFPVIETSGGGGTLRLDMALAIQPRGSYHANIYWGSRPSDVSNVMMCANLMANP